MKSIKKLLLSFIVIVTLIVPVTFLTACNGGEAYGQLSERFTVSFNTVHGSFIVSQSIEKGSMATRPNDPTRTGYIFKNWFTAQTGGTVFNFDSPITQDTIVHARWELFDITHPAMALRSEPFAAATGNPVVIDSFFDPNTGRNWHLVNVGYIRNAYISTVGILPFDGITPMGMSITNTTETTMTQALRTTVSSSVTVANTETHTAEASVGPSFLRVRYQWGRSHTITNALQNSFDESYTEANRVAQQINVNFTVGNHGEAAGWYRFALYADYVDVKFVLSTSGDNQTLHSWETVTFPRGRIFPRFEFCPGYPVGVRPEFNNSPQDGSQLINFDKHFYRDLNIPPRPPNNPMDGTFIFVNNGDTFQGIGQSNENMANHAGMFRVQNGILVEYFFIASTITLSGPNPIIYSWSWGSVSSIQNGNFSVASSNAVRIIHGAMPPTPVQVRATITLQFNQQTRQWSGTVIYRRTSNNSIFSNDTLTVVRV